MQNTEPISVAWGLDTSGAAPCLVRVSRTSAGLQFEQHPLEALAAAPDAEPLVVCLGDEFVLHRTLRLPAADDAALAQMVEAQLEVMLPARAHLFAWDWDPALDPAPRTGRRVWLCAARKDAVDQARRNAHARCGRQPSRLAPTSMALAAAVPALLADLPARAVVIDVAERGASMLVFHNGELADCVVLDPGPDQWSNQLREAYLAHVRGLAADQRPTACVVLERAAQTDGLEQAAGRALGLVVSPAVTSIRPPGAAQGVELPIAALAAAGAALTLVQPVRPTIVLSESAIATDAAATETAPRTSVKRRVLAVVGLVVALLALYVADVYEASWLEAAMARITPVVDKRGGYDRELALGRYLEKAGPAPLDVLAEISDLISPKVIISKWNYTNTGGVRLGGTAPNTEELHNLLKALAKAKTLANAEIKDQKIKDNKCQFEIAAQLSDRYVPTVKKKEEDEKDAAKEKAAGDKKEPPAKEAEPAQAGAKTEAEDKAKDKGKDQAPQPQPPALASPGTSQPDSTQPGTGKPDTGEADAGNADAAQDGAIEPGGGS